MIDKEKKQAYHKEWCERNKDKVAIIRKRSYEKNKEERLRKNREYYYKNKESVLNQHQDTKEERKAYMKKWREENKAYRKEYQKEYNIKNKEQKKKYREENREATRKIEQKRLDEWRSFFPAEIHCEMCNKRLYFNGKNCNTSMYLDHRTGNDAPIKYKPSNWLRGHKRTPETEKIFTECNFGILCNNCNSFLPTNERSEFLKNAIRYHKIIFKEWQEHVEENNNDTIVDNVDSADSISSK